jgi:regulatory factor X
VPRNRVYARYVGICANERIKPLNPASFGKLVRLMFPEIKTRRLGVRGQSKYHYCGIRLAGEQSSPKVSQGSGSASGSEPPAQAAGDDHLQVFNPSTPLSAKLLTGCRMSNGSAPPSFSSTSMQKKIQNSIKSSTYKASSISTNSPVSSFLQNGLYFSRNESDNLSSHEILKLPDIDLYAPPGTDPDISATLTAIYRSHCTSLIECVRYMRLKQFHLLFISFHGTLTTPVQKLLGEPTIASWIRESDWVMYKVGRNSFLWR